ncbi:MAG: hypothetical protein WC608_01480 [Parcubacteria group bacterium]
MNKNEFEKLINYIASQGLAVFKNTDEKNPEIDYLAIFSKNEDEYKELEKIAGALGEEMDKENHKTGRTFLLNEPMKISAGILTSVKVRLPDATRPQKGAPDFRVQDYQQFKDKYLQSSGNFTLMIRKDYEMIEIKGIDVLVYVPSKTLGERMKS